MAAGLQTALQGPVGGAAVVGGTGVVDAGELLLVVGALVVVGIVEVCIQ